MASVRKRKKVLVVLHSDLVPPKGFVTERARYREAWMTEYDVVHCLKSSGFNVEILPVAEDLNVLHEALKKFNPDIVFNLLEEFDGEAFFESHFVGLLEMLHIPYTGCNSKGLMLARDKALTKKILRFHEIPTSSFVVFRRGQKIAGDDLVFPAFVKALNEEASLGISKKSVVKNYSQLEERVAYFHDRWDVDVIAEEYLPGDEFYVAVMGGRRAQVLPIRQLQMGRQFREPRVYSQKAKWDVTFRKKMGIRSVWPRLDPELRDEMSELATETFSSLGLSGYARVDFRLDGKNRPCVLEVNPNPDIAKGEDFAEAARRAGYSYRELIETVVSNGLKWRYQG